MCTTGGVGAGADAHRMCSLTIECVLLLMCSLTVVGCAQLETLELEQTLITDATLQVLPKPQTLNPKP